MQLETIYIRPALTDQAGQCRIYSTHADIGLLSIGRHYEQHPELYREVGLMNSRGRLVCFDGPAYQREDLISSQPLMAGITFKYDATGEAA